jgi:hypothetical protein
MGLRDQLMKHIHPPKAATHAAWLNATGLPSHSTCMHNTNLLPIHQQHVVVGAVMQAVCCVCAAAAAEVGLHAPSCIRQMQQLEMLYRSLCANPLTNQSRNAAISLEAYKLTSRHGLDSPACSA